MPQEDTSTNKLASYQTRITHRQRIKQRIRREPPPPLTKEDELLLEAIAKSSQQPKGDLSQLIVKDVWRCGTCLADNKLSDQQCLCCEAPQQTKPVVSQEAKSEPEKKIEVIGSLSHLIRKDVWKCGDCMSENPLTVNQCQCCEASRPGTSQQVPQTEVKLPQANEGFKFPQVQGGFKFPALTPPQPITQPLPQHEEKWGEYAVSQLQPFAFELDIAKCVTLTPEQVYEDVKPLSSRFTFKL